MTDPQGVPAPKKSPATLMIDTGIGIVASLIAAFLAGVVASHFYDLYEKLISLQYDATVQQSRAAWKYVGLTTAFSVSVINGIFFSKRLAVLTCLGVVLLGILYAVTLERQYLAQGPEYSLIWALIVVVPLTLTAYVARAVFCLLQR